MLKEKTDQIDDYFSQLTSLQKKLARKFPSNDDDNSLMDEFSRVIAQEEITDDQIKNSLNRRDFFIAQKLIEKSKSFKKHYVNENEINSFLMKTLKGSLKIRNLALIVNIQETIETQKSTNISMITENIRSHKNVFLNALEYYYITSEYDTRDQSFFNSLLTFLFSDKNLYREVRADFNTPKSFLSVLLSRSTDRENLELMKQNIEKTFREECLVVSIPSKSSLFGITQPPAKQEKNELQVMLFQQKR
jgi:hypothetical protein